MSATGGAAAPYDVVVLGGGPGGYATALYGAAAGLRIALVEEDEVGGTCLHRGCVPAKELLQTAEVLRTVRGAGPYGVRVGDVHLDLPTGMSRKREIVAKLTRGLEGLLSGRKVDLFRGRGTVADAAGRQVELADGTRLSGRALVLATGSEPRPLPGVPFDGERVLSSDHVLELERVPVRAVIVGGGAIGCEFASYLADLGTQVTVLEALPSILPGVDEQVSAVVARSFRRRGITVRTGVQVAGVEATPAGVRVAHTDGGAGPDDASEGDIVVVSVGRRPRSGGLGLEAQGVSLGPGGHVLVDPHRRTAVPGVYAVGDLVPGPALAHVAFAEAIVAVRSILGEDVTPIDEDRVPWCIYCHPEVAFAGLTEAEARRRGHDVVTAVHRFGGNSRALILGEAEGVVKLVAERDGPLLGVHIAGPWATELLAEGYLAVNWEATAADVAALVHPHPTLSEAFGEAALALAGRSLH
jgi:dihydrolipoamide dehydrogenase